MTTSHSKSNTNTNTTPSKASQAAHMAEEQMNRLSNKFTVFEKLEDKLGVPKAYLAALSLLAFCVMLFSGFGTKILATFIGFVYPSYKSFKVLSSLSGDVDWADSNVAKERIEGVQTWLMYWVCYSCFNLLEWFSDSLLYWIPFYWPGKLFLLFLMVHPRMNGAKMMYETLVAPVLQNHEHIIDRHLDDLANHSKSAISGITAEGVGLLQSQGAALVAKGAVALEAVKAQAKEASDRRRQTLSERAAPQGATE